MVLFNHKNKFVLINIPKTAGTTLGKRLQSHGFKIDSGLFKEIKSSQNKNYWHLSIEELKSIPHIWNRIYNYTFVCIVRNPYDRFYSAYLEFTKRYNSRLGFNSYISFAKQQRYKTDYRYIHAKPMHCFIFTNTIQPHTHKKKPLKKMNTSSSSFISRPTKLIILRQETLEHDYKQFIKYAKLGSMNRKDKLNTNMSLNDLPKPPCYYYNKLSMQDVKNIQKIYQADFDIFNYSKNCSDSEYLFIS